MPQQWVTCVRCGFPCGYFGRRSKQDGREFKLTLHAGGGIDLGKHARGHREKLLWYHYDCMTQREYRPSWDKRVLDLYNRARQLNLHGYFPNYINTVTRTVGRERRIIDAAKPFKRDPEELVRSLDDLKADDLPRVFWEPRIPWQDRAF